MTKPSGTGETSVYRDVLAGNVRVLGAAEPHDEPGDLPDVRHAPGVIGRDELGDVCLADDASGKFGIDDTRRNAISQYAIGPVLDRERERHPVEGELAR